MGRIKLDYTDRLSRGLIQLGGQNYDIILLDLNLPDSRGLDTLNTTIKRFPKIPVVVLSGLADDAITIEAVRRGAQDYLVKGEISGPLVMRVMRYAIERKQVEAMLRASEARYRTLVETSPNGITLADLEGKLLLSNQQAARLHGYANPEAMLGMDVFKLVAPVDRRAAALNTQKTLNENRAVNAEYTLLRRDGSVFPGEISTALLRNNAGAPAGFISISRDISERTKAIEAEKQIVLLENEFISNVSEELRGPLVNLVDYFNLVRTGKLTNLEEKNTSLLRASRDTNRLLDMIDELQDFALLESERLVLHVEQVEIGEVINDVLQICQEQAASKQVALLSSQVDQSLFVDVDVSRIRRVLIKLMENAVRFSVKGGKVLVTAKSMNDRLMINVIDEGPGMSVEDSAKIFEKFSQVNQTQNGARVGLRLYTAKQIVEAHSGTLTVSSQLGAGSTFTITIPVNRTA